MLSLSDTQLSSLSFCRGWISPSPAMIYLQKCVRSVTKTKTKSGFETHKWAVNWTTLSLTHAHSNFTFLGCENKAKLNVENSLSYKGIMLLTCTNVNSAHYLSIYQTRQWGYCWAEEGGLSTPSPQGFDPQALSCGQPTAAAWIKASRFL